MESDHFYFPMFELKRTNKISILAFTNNKKYCNFLPDNQQLQTSRIFMYR